MEIIFTRHALQRIEEREIRLAEVIKCLASPTKIKFSEGKAIYLKLNQKEQYLLILICSIDADSCRIITAIKTSKINKYL